jgi:hypothetical protein
VTCDDSEATFWTLYARNDKGLSQGIIDLAFREDAEAALAVYAERDALQEQVQKLAAENVGLKSAIESHAAGFSICEACGEENTCGNDDFCRSLDETPATDAVIREVEATAELEGMVKGAGRVALEASQVYRVAPQNSDERSLHKTIGNFAHRVARRIRAGEQP